MLWWSSEVAVGGVETGGRALAGHDITRMEALNPSLWMAVSTRVAVIGARGCVDRNGWDQRSEPIWPAADTRAAEAGIQGQDRPFGGGGRGPHRAPGVAGHLCTREVVETTVVETAAVLVSVGECLFSGVLAQRVCGCVHSTGHGDGTGSWSINGFRELCVLMASRMEGA